MLKLLGGHRRAVVLAITVLVIGVSSVSALASSPRPVRVADDSFSAKRLTISRGTRVNWKWVGFVDHNVTVRSGPAKFHSRTQARGSFSHVFTRRGTYTLYCTVHPETMKMTVVVR